MGTPEVVILFGAFLWLGAALVTGLPRGYIPSEIPFLFAVISAIGALIGVSEWVPETVDVAFTFAAATLYLVTPVVFTIWLLHRYDPNDNEGRDGPKTIT